MNIYQVTYSIFTCKSLDGLFHV